MIIKLQNRIERVTQWLGNLCAVLMLAMLLLATLVVVMRYGLEIGSIALQESVLYLHGALFTLGAGFALKHNSHVRVDIFYREFTDSRRALIDLAGTFLLLLPFLGFIAFHSWEYVANSWIRLEGSAEAGGLTIVYIQKSLILALVVTLILQAVAEVVRAWTVIKGGQSA